MNHEPCNLSRLPRVLVVDDTPDNLFLMNGLLEDRFEVIEAASGAEALRLATEAPAPDLVLLDIMMPDMDGYEVLRRLRQHPLTATLPVVFLTALAAPKDVRLGLDLGAMDYLTKPVDPNAVAARLEAHARSTLRARQIEALAGRLAPHLEPGAWEELFGPAGSDFISFEQRTATLLYVDRSDPSRWTDEERSSFRAELQWLATRHQGTVDGYGWSGATVLFDDPAQCVRAALTLQRCAPELRLRMGVHTAVVELATFRSEGEWRHTLIGNETEAVAQVAASAAAGSVVISAETYSQVRPQVHAESHGCLLTEEFQDTDVATASLTPAPAMGGQGASTFAGLGRL